MSDYILEMNNVTKEFPGVKALDNVTLKVKRGEIHSLCGENGAGKSTLMKVLSGVYTHNTFNGEIKINGEKCEFHKIKDSEKVGVAIIYQELALVKEMNVCENIYLGNEFSKMGLINWDLAFVETKKLLDEVGLDVNPSSKVGFLGIGQQQIIEIAKAIAKKTDLLILDEPTAALTESETNNLLNILITLKNKGVTCIYISHKLNEVFRISDSISVLRDGKNVGTFDASKLNEDEVIALMVGRKLTQRFPTKVRTPKETVLEVKNWNVHDFENEDKKIIDNASFVARKGEILGISGLMGAGRTELFTSIFGSHLGRSSGEIIIEGKKVKIKNPRESIKAGICYLSEDRKRNGLVLIMDIKNNITLANMDKIAMNFVVNENKEIIVTKEYIESLQIKTPSLEQKTKNLSGGNQQKVVLAKWLMAKPKVLIMDEPTRGIDVGAKYEIYNLMNKLVEDGVSIIMISSELPEILGMSDRVLVMHEGKLSAEFDRKEATQEKILYYATGGNGNGK